MQRLISFVTLLAFGVPAVAVLPAPRRSPEFEIVEPSGKHTLLSSFKGNVVLIEFLMTNCPHCQRVSRTIGKLHRELGPRGFQPIGIAFEPGLTARMAGGRGQLPQPFGSGALNGSSDRGDRPRGRDSRTERREGRSTSGGRVLLAQPHRRSAERGCAVQQEEVKPPIN